MTNMLRIAIHTALGLSLMAASSPAQIPSAFTLENTWLEVSFTTDANDLTPGTSVEVTQIQRRRPLPVPGPMAMSQGSGAWTVRFTRDHAEYTGAGICPGSAADPLEWFDVSMDGSVDRWNPSDPSPLGSLDALTLDSVTLTPGGLGNSAVTIQWSLTVTLEGQTADYQVDTDWRVLPGRPFTETSLSVSRTSPVEPDYYVAEAVHPEMFVSSMQGPSTPKDTLVLPWVIGNLVTNPTDETKPFTSFLAAGPNFFPVNLAAYYDGEQDGNTFYITANDGDDYWKELWIDATGPSNDRNMSFRMRHVPDNIFDSVGYVMPYAVRIGALTGDWWDVADTYRNFLQTEVSWYEGPVGSPANNMPQHAKDLVAEVYMVTGYQGDRMDILNRQMMNITRVLRGCVNAVWYGAYFPDEFAKFFYNGGYLPGLPSFVGAVREAQKQFDTTVSPYVNSSSAADYLDPEIVDPPPPTQMHLDVHDSFMLDEDLEEEYFCFIANSAPRHALLCPGAQWWRHAFVSQTAAIANFTDMRGLYLDFWLTSACYASDHGPDGKGSGHLPGGGNWMYRKRLDQLKEIRAAVPQELLITQEFVLGRYSEEIDLMHHDLVTAAISAEDHPGTTVPKPMENARAVPLFRAIFDNIKLSRIASQAPALAGRRSWIEANNTFTFGMIPEVTQQLIELLPAFGQRFNYSQFYDFLNSYPGPSSLQAFSTVTPPTGGGAGTGSSTTDTVIIPQKNAFNSPYYRFLRTLAGALKTHGFLTWHNGTIRRLPDFTVTPVAGFTGVPGVETDLSDEQNSTPTYIEDFLTPGMFQAPFDLGGVNAGSLAFAVANPWVDPSQLATFPLEFTFEPELYPGWTDQTVYSVTRYNANGLVALLVPNTSGPLTLNRNVPSGEITWWVFRDSTTVIDPDP